MKTLKHQKYHISNFQQHPWGEKEGTQTNLDRTITKQKNWQEFLLIVKLIGNFPIDSQKLGHKEAFNFSSPKEIFEEYQEMTKLNPHLNIYEASYDNLHQTLYFGEKINKIESF